MKVRTRRFNGRCGRHKRYNPATEGRGGIKGGCPRCNLLCDIFETAVKLNEMIKRFGPAREKPVKVRTAPAGRPEQLSLLPDVLLSEMRPEARASAASSGM